MIDSYAVNVESDQGMSSVQFAGGTYATTPVPASLTADLEAGTYLLTWSAEVMRTDSGGVNNFFVRMRDTTAGVSHGFIRHIGGTAASNGPNTAIPTEGNLTSGGELYPFAGSTIVELPAGVRTYRIEYTMSNASPSITSVWLRAHHQHIGLMRIE